MLPTTLPIFWMSLKGPTTTSVASIAAIAVVALSSAAIAVVVASVIVSSVGIVTIVVTTIASRTTSSIVASPFTAAVVACNAADIVGMLADTRYLQQMRSYSLVFALVSAASMTT